MSVAQTLSVGTKWELAQMLLKGNLQPNNHTLRVWRRVNALVKLQFTLEDGRKEWKEAGSKMTHDWYS
jgi:hypothetical protein